MAKDKLIKIIELSSPVYVQRYYSTSGETAEQFKEYPDVKRFRGECRDTKEDDIYKWLDENAMCLGNRNPGESSKIEGKYLFSGENGVLCKINIEIVFPEPYDQGRVDYAHRHNVTIRSQPTSKGFPQELSDMLDERGYVKGKLKINGKLMSFPAKKAA